jgi:acetyl-CoA carboxylase carboxyl transferase subunit alpha
VVDLKVSELVNRRYERLQSYGRFTDTKADAKTDAKSASK